MPLTPVDIDSEKLSKLVESTYIAALSMGGEVSIDITFGDEIDGELRFHCGWKVYHAEED